MSKFEIINPSEDSIVIEVLVELDFVRDLKNLGINQLVEHVSDIIQGQICKAIQVNIVHLNLSTKSLNIRFSYLRDIPKSQIFQMLSDEEISRIRMNFIFYFVAKVDTKYKLVDGDLPHDFRYFENLPNQLNDYYGLNLTN